jgi:hypothetical protein
MNKPIFFLKKLLSVTALFCLAGCAGVNPSYYQCNIYLESKAASEKQPAASDSVLPVINSLMDKFAIKNIEGKTPEDKIYYMYYSHSYDIAMFYYVNDGFIKITAKRKNALINDLITTTSDNFKSSPDIAIRIEEKEIPLSLYDRLQLN